MRTASLLHFLAQRYRLHVVTFAVGGDGDSGDPLPAGTAAQLDWIRLPRHSKNVAARITRNGARLLRGVLPLTDRFCEPRVREQVARVVGGRRYRLAVLEHFWCAPYLEMLRSQADAVIMDMTDIESALHATCARSEPWPASWGHRVFMGMAARAERELLPRFDLVLATSEADREKIRTLAPGARVAVYPNAIPVAGQGAGCGPGGPPHQSEEHCVAFSGNFEYHPNIGAVRFFLREVWPALRRRDPGLRWRLIGRNDWAIREWVAGDTRIEATGPVEDALRELARARVVVVPVLAGSGTRVKILEAWAAARPVVSTRLGAEGLPAVHGQNLLLADSPHEILEAILLLLKDTDLRRRLGQAGRRTVEEQLCWPVVWDKLDRALLDSGLPSTIFHHEIVNSATIGDSA